MATGKSSTPMEMQPSTDWKDAPSPMGPSPKKARKSGRAPRPAIPEGNAELSRRAALTKQRSQMETLKRSKAL
jgi:hypothetical protein